MNNCELCGKYTKRICTHHIIPRYISISSDNDTIEICPSCHTKIDITWHSLLLWGEMKSPSWNNKEKAKLAIKNWEKLNYEKVRKYRREWARRKNRELGVPERKQNIINQYKNLDIFKQQLQELYWDRQLSWRQVAKQMNLSLSCIIQWHKKFRIPSREKSLAVSTAIFNMQKKTIQTEIMVTTK